MMDICKWMQMVFIVRRHFGDFISLVLVAFDRHGGRVSSKPGEQCPKALPVDTFISLALTFFFEITTRSETAGSGFLISMLNPNIIYQEGEQ
jgi:hypothetical protein